MFDLNTIIAQALAQAIEQATKPLIERITALESQALAARLTELEQAHDEDVEACRYQLDRLETRVGALEVVVEDATLAQATKPLITRIERLEAQAIAENTATEDHDLLHRLDRRVDKLEAQAEDAITANQINSLIEDALSEIDWEDQVRDVLDQHDIADQIDEKIEEALSQLKIVRQ